MEEKIETVRDWKAGAIITCGDVVLHVPRVGDALIRIGGLDCGVVILAPSRGRGKSRVDEGQKFVRELGKLGREKIILGRVEYLNETIEEKRAQIDAVCLEVVLLTSLARPQHDGKVAAG